MSRQGVNLASEARGQWAVPMVAKRFETSQIYNSVLPASGEYATTVAVDVWKSRKVHLLLVLTPGAVGAQISIVPEVNCSEDPSDTKWFTVGVTDGTVTENDLVDPPDAPTSTYYADDNFGSVTFRPLDIRTVAGATTQPIRMAVTLDVEQAAFVRFKISEIGVPATPSTVSLSIAKSV